MDETLFVTPEEADFRLDKLLSTRFPTYSRHYFQYLIKEKLVLVNGAVVKKSAKLEQGDEVEIEFALTPEISLEAEEIPLDILFEDDDLIAINKRAGMVVHPAVGNWSGTFVNALLFHCQHLPKRETLRPGIVHRLDKETSGVLVAAKNERAQQLMVEKFASRQIEKEYVAICVGNPGDRMIEGRIGRHPYRRKEMTIVEGEKGREARTKCVSVAHNKMFSLVHLFPETGRTHQLRVHLKSVGTPVLGDSVYGVASMNQKMGVKRQLLHAYALHFTHPITKVTIELKAPIPQDIGKIIKQITNHAPFDTES